MSEGRVTELAEAQKRTEEKVAALAESQKKMQDILGDLQGRSLEGAYRDKAHAYSGRILRRPQVISLRGLEDTLETGLSQGEFVDVLWLDLLIKGRPAGSLAAQSKLCDCAGGGRENGDTGYGGRSADAGRDRAMRWPCPELGGGPGKHPGLRSKGASAGDDTAGARNG